MEDCSIDGQGGDGINSRWGWNQFKVGMEVDHQCPRVWDPGVDLWGAEGCGFDTGVVHQNADKGYFFVRGRRLGAEWLKQENRGT